MIAWANFSVLVVSTVLVLLLYVRSVLPAHRELTEGEVAWKRCMADRIWCGVMMTVTMVNYVAYLFFPLPTGLPERFVWPYWVAAVLGAVVAVPAATVMLWGAIDAGEESIRPDKSHTLYRGIYRYIRHPQGLGESLLWLAIAFFLNSPFLALYSLVWPPIFYVMVMSEERDLLLRYGEPYAAYRATTGAFWPKWSALAGDQNKSGSSQA